MRLQGKTALITGASRNICKADFEDESIGICAALWHLSLCY